MPREQAPTGFHSVTLWVERGESVEKLLTQHLGFTREGQEQDPEGIRTRYRGDTEGVGRYVDVIERPGKPRGNFGAGSVHHVALRTRDDSEQEEYREHLTKRGYQVTPVQDRQYFHSIYFRDPSGVLFEVATDAPGFPNDETVEELGRTLKLPEWYESKREAIERQLAPVLNHEYGVTIGGRQGGGSEVQAGNEPTKPRFEGPHQGQPVYAAGRPVGEARVAAVLVHGRGGSARDILSLAGNFSMSAFAYLAPEARGNTWYPQSFLQPIERNEPGLSSGLQMIEDILGELARQGVPPEHVVLGGFSQGACLTLEFVARNARRYGGVFAYSGGLIGPEGTSRDYPGSLDGTPVFLGCSDVDAHIPVERVHHSADVIERLGGRVDKRIYPGLAHTINDDEISAVREMMQALAANSLG